MSKKISTFILSLALVFCAFFGLSACKGPLDDLTVKVTAPRLTEVDGGFETTLVLGTEQNTLTISASVDNVGDKISREVVWSCSDKSKISVSDIKYEGGRNFATITGLTVTEQGAPVKLVVSSIEKTKAQVALWVNVVAEAKHIAIRDNTGIAVKGGVYVPNILDYFTFTDDNGSTNVTTPNYDYLLGVVLSDGTARNLDYNEAIPMNTVSMSIRFIPSDDNVFDSAIYSTQSLDVPSSKIVLYEPLDNIDYALKLDDGDGDKTNDPTINLIEMVLNKGNGQGQKYYLDGVNKDIMSVNCRVSPSTFADYLYIEQDSEDEDVFYFAGQDETGANNVFVEFEISYNDPSLTSKYVFRVPFRVASYPDTITINGDRTQGAYQLTVYNNYATAGEALALSLSPYSSLYKNLRIKLINDSGVMPSGADNLEWYIGGSATPSYIKNSTGLVVASGSRIMLQNGLDADHEYGSGQLHYLVTLEDATAINELSREIVITLAYGINDITVTDDTHALHTDGKMYLAMDEDATSREISLTVWPQNTDPENMNGANPEDILDESRYVVEPAGIVEVTPSQFSASSYATFSVKPLRMGAAVITWTAPTGVSLSIDVVVFSKFNAYSIGVRGQSSVIGQIDYETEKDENDLDVNKLDENGQPIIKKIKAATGSTIELNNVLGPSNAFIADVRYNVVDRNIVTSVNNASSNYGTAVMRTDKRGTTTVNCIVEYYDVEEGNLVTKTKNYSFEVQTYNKVQDLTLTDPNITLYAKEDSAGRVYNTQLTTRQVNIITASNGMIDAVEDDAEWRVVSSSSNVSTLTITGAVSRDDGEPNVYYGSYIVVMANSINLKDDRVITTIEVKLRDYNTYLTTRLVVTVMPFEVVKNASFDTTSLNSFNVVQNNQTASKKTDRVVSLYTEVDNAENAYFALRPNVTPVRAANKNLEYVVFDADQNNVLTTKTGSARICDLLSIVTQDGTDRIVINYDSVQNRYKVGNAFVYVLAQDALTKYVSDIKTVGDLESVQSAILMRFEITVADGNESAYRIYSADDFYKIYAQPDKNYVLMKDLDNVDLSRVINTNHDSINNTTTYTLDTSFGGSLSSFDENIRTVTFVGITIEMDNDGRTLWNGVAINKESVGIFNELTGKVFNVNFVISSYTYISKEVNSVVHSNIGIFVKQIGAKVGNEEKAGSIKNVTLTIGNINIDNNTNNHSGVASNLNIGAIAKVYNGSVTDFNVYAPTAVAKLYNKTNISLGIASVEDNTDVDNSGGNNLVSGVVVKGNLTINGNSGATNIVYGGVIAQNNKKKTSGNFRVKHLESMANLNATIPLDCAGGVVGVNNVGGVYDARYLVINEADAQFNGLNLKQANSAGGVVGKNTGAIDYAYAFSFVPSKGITLNNEAGVDGNSAIGGIVGLNDGQYASLSKAFSNLTINSVGEISKISGIVGENTTGASAADYYSNSAYNYEGSATVNLKVIVQTTAEGGLWATNSTYTGGYFDGGVYKYLNIYERQTDENGCYVYDDECNNVYSSVYSPYLPMVPTSLSAQNTPYLIMENIGGLNDNSGTSYYNHIPVTISNIGGNYDAITGDTTVKTTTNNTFKMFGLTANDGLFVLNFPPLSRLNELLISVTNTNNNVARVIPGVYASGYEVMIVGEGTTVIGVYSALNPDACTTLQLCVVKGYNGLTIANTNTETVYENSGTINLKKDVREQFSVDYLDVAGNAVSAGQLQTSFVALPNQNTVVPSSVALDSFVLQSSEVSIDGTPDPVLSLQKQINAQFYLNDALQNLNVFPVGHSWQYTVHTTSGPSAISLSQGDVDIYAGDHIYLNVDVICDDGFNNDALYIYVDNGLYAQILTDGSVKYFVNDVYYSFDDYVNTIGAAPMITINVIGCTLNNNVKTFNLEYFVSNPEEVLLPEEYGVEFEARPISVVERGDVVAGYTLHIDPQIITAVDMYHYIDVQNEGDALVSAGGVPSTSIVAGGYGILKLTIDPYYVNYDRIEITSSVVDGYVLVFDQRRYVEDGDRYEVMSGTDITILDNGIITHKTTDENKTGILFFRTYMPQKVPASALFNIYIKIYDKDNNLLFTKTKLYSIYASSAMSLSYDNFDAPNGVAYIAKGTGGQDAADVYGQNANLLSVFVQQGLISPKIICDNNSVELIPLDGNGTINASTHDVSKQYYVKVPNTINLGTTFNITLSAQTYIAGVLTTLENAMQFKVVDMAINLKWATPENSETLKLALNGSASVAAIGGAISNVYDGNWTFSYTVEPIQITAFVSDLRKNRELLDINVENIGTENATYTLDEIVAMLRNVPEFSFEIAKQGNDYTEDTITNIKNVVALLQSINKVSGNNNVDKVIFGYYDDVEKIYRYPSETPTEQKDGQVVNKDINGINWIVDGVYKIKATDVNADPMLITHYYAYYNNASKMVVNSADGEGLIEYKMTFKLKYEENTSQAHPLPVRTLEDFVSMEAGKDYILLGDIDLNGSDTKVAFKPISTAISSFDGNNYKLILSKSENPFDMEGTSNNIGVFASVGAETILKNVTIEVQNDTSIVCYDENNTSASYNIGLLAGQNSGVITNCKVLSPGVESGDNENATTIYKTLTFTADRQHNSSIVAGGLVAVNQGYISNSNVEYINFAMTYVTFGGLVAQNNSIISASYVNNVKINNTVATGDENANQLGGLVAINGGAIAQSYVGGAKNDSNWTRLTSISSNSAFGGFVHNNSGSITDCYATINVDNTQTVRASGFVFNNSGSVLRCYTASKPTANSNIYSRPFVGTTSSSHGEVALNSGSVSDSYYLADEYNQYQFSAEVAVGMTKDNLTNSLTQSQQWPNYSFAYGTDSNNNVNTNGVWASLSKTTLGPALISANIPGLANNVHQKIDRVETTAGNTALYWYTLVEKKDGQDDVARKYNTKDSIALIYDAFTFNDMFEKANANDICASDQSYCARIVRPIDLSVLSANNIQIKTMTKILRGSIFGNGMTINGVDISYYDTGYAEDKAGSFDNLTNREHKTEQVSDSNIALGLFGEVCGGLVGDLNINVSNVYAETHSRLFVGGLAGRVLDGTIYNINLTGDGATVLGRHVVGGVVGAAYGQSRISNITSNINVTSAYTSLNDAMAVVYNFDMNRLAGGKIVENEYNKMSVAGGLFGIIDLFDYEYKSSTEVNITKEISEKVDKYISTNLNFEGNNIVISQIAGGVSGVVGINTVINNAHTTISPSTHIRGSVYAGGLVGQNNGTIKYSSVQYEDAIHQAVSEANTGALTEGASTTVFDSVGYCSAVGGLVGANFGQSYPIYGQSGVIRYANSNIYVDAPHAQNVGGLVGIVFGGDIRAVYATGYVVGANNASVGGLVGTLTEITEVVTNIAMPQNISPRGNLQTNLLVEVANPFVQQENTISSNENENENENEGADDAPLSIYPQVLLLDFVVAQTNWASDYYTYYQNLKQYGHLGGLVGYATDSSLLTTSHNGDHYGETGYTEDMTVAINYYNKYITRNPVAPNTTINTEQSGNILKIPAFHIDGYDANEVEERTRHIAVGDTRNNAYSQTKWDWFALWDEYSIAGRNADDTPILSQGIFEIDGSISNTKDFIKMYWHPDRDYYLTNNIYFVNEQGNQISYIMVGTSNLPFSGEFDGKGFTIEGLSVSNYLTNIGGLFGCVSGYETKNGTDTTPKHAVVKNLTIKGIKVNNLRYTGDTSNPRVVNNKYTTSIGGLAGTAKLAKIENVVITGLELDFIAQNTDKSTVRYVGGLFGKAEDDVSIINCGVMGLQNEKQSTDLFNGINILQTPATSNESRDVLYIGGLVGYASNVKINKNNNFLMTVANVDIDIQNVYSNTYYGAAVGYAENVEAYGLIVSGEHTITGLVDDSVENPVKLYVGGYYGLLNGSGPANIIKASYAYSTIRLVSLTGANINNITIAYDFNLAEDATITMGASNIINGNSDTKSLSELFELHNEHANLRSYNATSIINNLGVQSNLNITKYYDSAKNSRSGMPNKDTLEYYIALDPYYSLTIKDDNYNIEDNDLTIAQGFYSNMVKFVRRNGNKYQNEFGYQHTINLAGADLENTDVKYYITQEKDLLKDVFGKIAKLYLTISDDVYNITKYGTIQLVTNNMSGDDFSTEQGVYYALVSDIRLRGQTGKYYVFDELSGFINGHNHVITLQEGATTLAHTVSGVVSGVQVVLSGNSFEVDNNQSITSRGILADELTAGGCIFASGTSAVLDNTTTSQSVTVALTLPQNKVFGGVVGTNNGVVNNCWSHISYNINSSQGAEYAAFGGVVGKSNGGILANLNYYGESVIGNINQNKTGGILGVATAQTDMYMVLSFIFAYKGKYHITQANNNINLVLYAYEDVNNHIQTKTTAKYFSMSVEGDIYGENDKGVGEAVDFASVFKNVDINNTEEYHTQFTQYYGMWDEEQNGVNYGLVKLKVEPEVKSKSGATEDDAIEVPNEIIFAGMLEYEKSKAGRFYILTKEEENGVYNLQEIQQSMDDLGYTGAANNHTTINNGEAFYGHIIGNKKTLKWPSGSNPVPLVNKMGINATGYYSGTNINPYIKNLDIVYAQNVSVIMNVLANINESLISDVNYFAGNITVNPSTYANTEESTCSLGGLVGVNKGQITNTIVHNLNITLTGNAADANTSVYIGVVAGSQAGSGDVILRSVSTDTCSIVTNNFTDNAKTLYVGGLVGYNQSGEITSTTANNYLTLRNNNLVYFAQDTYVYFYDTVNIKKYADKDVDYTEILATKHSVVKFEEGSFIRVEKNARVLPLAGGEYQVYAILTDYMVQFNTVCNVLKFEGNQIKTQSVETTAANSYALGQDMIIIQGEYMLYKYIHFDDTDGNILVTNSASTIQYLTASGGAYVATGEPVAFEDGNMTYYPGQNETGTKFGSYAIVKSGSVTLYDTEKITQSYDTIWLKNKEDPITVYYAYESGSEYIVKRARFGNHDWGAYNQGYNTGEKKIWLSVDSGFVTNGSASRHNYGTVYYESDRQDASASAGTNTSYSVGDNTIKPNGNVVVSNINTPTLNNVGGITGFNEGTIYNLYVAPTVVGNQYVGGVAGYNKGTIAGVTVDGSRWYTQNATLTVVYVWVTVENASSYTSVDTLPAASADTYGDGNKYYKCNDQYYKTEVYRNINRADGSAVALDGDNLTLDSETDYYVQGTLTVNGKVVVYEEPTLVRLRDFVRLATFTADSYVGGVTGQNGANISGVLVQYTTVFANNTNESFAGGIAGSNQNEKYNSAIISGGVLNDVTVGFETNPVHANSSLITGFNNSGINLSGTNLNDVQLWVNSVPYDANHLTTTATLGFVTTENFGQITFGSSRQNSLQITGHSKINYVLVAGQSNAGGWSEHAGSYTVKIGGVAGVNHGAILGAYITDSKLDGISLVFNDDREATNSVFMGGVTAENIEGARLTINSVDVQFVDYSNHNYDEHEYSPTQGMVVVTNDNTVVDKYIGGVVAINRGYVAGSTPYGVSSSNTVYAQITATTGHALGGVVAKNEEGAIIYNVNFGGRLNAQQGIETTETITVETGTEVVLLDEIDTMNPHLNPVQIMEYKKKGYQLYGERYLRLYGTRPTYATYEEKTTHYVETTGGIVGENNGIVINCGNNSQIYARNNTGGIVGTNNTNGLVAGATFGGTVQGYDNVGGIAGRNLGTIKKSTQQNAGDNSSVTIGTNNTSMIMDNATINTNQPINFGTNGTMLGGTFAYNIPAGGSYKAIVIPSITATFASEAKITFLNDAVIQQSNSGVTFTSQIVGNGTYYYITAGQTATCQPDSYIIFVTNAWVELSNTSANDVAVTYTGAGSVFVNDTFGEGKISSDTGVNVDGYVNISTNSLSFNITSGTIYSWVSGITVKNNIYASNSNIKGLVGYNAGTGVTISSVSPATTVQQTYVADTQSTLVGTVLHTAGTTVKMGEEDDDINQLKEILPAGAQVKYAAGTMLKLSVPVKTEIRYTNETGDNNLENYKPNIAYMGKIVNGNTFHNVYLIVSKDGQNNYYDAGDTDDGDPASANYNSRQIYQESDGWYFWFKDNLNNITYQKAYEGEFEYIPAGLDVTFNSGTVRFGAKYVGGDNPTITDEGAYPTGSGNIIITTHNNFENSVDEYGYPYYMDGGEAKYYIISSDPRLVANNTIETTISTHGTSTNFVNNGQGHGTGATLTYSSDTNESFEYTKVVRAYYKETKVDNGDGTYSYAYEYIQTESKTLEVVICCETDTTITYPNRTTVYVKGTQTYLTNTTSEFNIGGTITHYAGTSVVFDCQNEATISEVYKNSTQIYYPQSTNIEMALYKNFDLYGEQTFTEQTSVIIDNVENTFENGDTNTSAIDDDDVILTVDDKVFVVPINNENNVVTYKNYDNSGASTATTVQYAAAGYSVINGTVRYLPASGERITVGYDVGTALTYTDGTTITISNDINVTVSAGTSITALSDVRIDGTLYTSGSSPIVYSQETTISISKVAATTILTFSAGSSLVFNNAVTVEYVVSSSVEYTNSNIKHFALYQSGTNMGQPIVYIMGDGTTETFDHFEILTVVGKINYKAYRKMTEQYIQTTQDQVVEDTQIGNNTSSVVVTGHSNVGGAVGLNNNGIISGVTLNNVNIATLGGSNAGGFVGCAAGEMGSGDGYYDGYKVCITDCVVNNITIDKQNTEDGGYNERAGGFAGLLQAISLQNCIVKGNVQIDAAYTIGGFAGQVGRGSNTLDVDFLWWDAITNYDGDTQVTMQNCGLGDTVETFHILEETFEQTETIYFVSDAQIYITPGAELFGQTFSNVVIVKYNIDTNTLSFENAGTSLDSLTININYITVKGEVNFGDGGYVILSTGNAVRGYVYSHEDNPNGHGVMSGLGGEGSDLFDSTWGDQSLDAANVGVIFGHDPVKESWTKKHASSNGNEANRNPNVFYMIGNIDRRK